MDNNNNHDDDANKRRRPEDDNNSIDLDRSNDARLASNANILHLLVAKSAAAAAALDVIALERLSVACRLRNGLVFMSVVGVVPVVVGGGGGCDLLTKFAVGIRRSQSAPMLLADSLKLNSVCLQFCCSSKPITLVTCWQVSFGACWLGIILVASL